MLRRMSYIENGRVLADSGVITSPVNIRDVITSIYFEIRGVNGASWNQANPIALNVQSLELIDGSEVLMSLTGPQLAAYAAYKVGHFPYMMNDEFPGSTQTLSVEIPFGRWFGDTVYALDASRFSNLQLRLTWNLATVRAIGATGYVTGSGRFTALASIMEGAPAPQGMLVARQHYQFQTAAAGTTFVVLPTDRRLRSILLRSSQQLWGGIPGISRARLTADQDKFVAFDLGFDEIVGYMAERNRPFTLKQTYMLQNTTVLQSVFKYDEQVNLQGYQGDTVILYTNNGAGFGTVNQFTAGVADANMRSYAANVFGWMPFHCAQFDLGEWDDPNTWLDATLFKNLQFQLTNNAAGSAASVVLEQELVY